LGFIQSTGDVMGDEPIPKDLLDAIRQLNDQSLTRLIEEINAVGWVRASETLRLMVKEKEEWK